MSKQTAVEYLIQYMMNNQYFVGNDLADVFEQAKSMEREQIEESYGVGHNDGCAYMTDGKKEFENAEQYYNETYKGGEQ